MRGEHSRVVIKFDGALKFARDGYPASGSVWGASYRDLCLRHRGQVPHHVHRSRLSGLVLSCLVLLPSFLFAAGCCELTDLF